MDTNEAIEIIENMCEALSKQDNFGGGGTDADTVMMEIEVKKVITLLKQGEAYRRMWEELYVIHGNTIVDDIASLNNVMEIMEQKYLIKKEAKQAEKPERN